MVLRRGGEGFQCPVVQRLGLRLGGGRCFEHHAAQTLLLQQEGSVEAAKPAADDGDISEAHVLPCGTCL